MCIAAPVFSQSAIHRVVNSAAAFGTAIPAGSLLSDQGSGKTYRVLVAQAGTRKITDMVLGTDYEELPRYRGVLSTTDLDKFIVDSGGILKYRTGAGLLSDIGGQASLTGTAYKLAAFTNTNVLGELVAVGATGEYLAGATGAIPAWATLNQAAIAGLTTASSPAFVNTKLSALTDGYIPYHVADATGFGNSPIYTNGTNVGIGTTAPGTYYSVGARLDVQTTGTTVFNHRWRRVFC